MALQAEGPHVRQVALTAAFRDRNDVVGVPERFPAAFAQVPGFQKLTASCIVEFSEIPAKGDGVGAALGADSAVSREDLFAEITGIGPQFPFMDAEVRAEGAAAFWHLDATPAAEGTTGGSAFELRSLDPSSIFAPSRFNAL
jgi:hypothetical protein